MARSGQQLGEKAPEGGGGLRGDVAGRRSARLREELAGQRDVGGFGKQFAVVADQMGGEAFGQGRRQVGGVGFEQEMAGRHARGVFAGARVLGPGEGAAKGNIDVLRREGRQGVGGAGVGVDQEPGGMRRVKQAFDPAGLMNPGKVL